MSELVPVLSGVVALTLLITVNRGLRSRDLRREYLRRLEEHETPKA